MQAEHGQRLARRKGKENNEIGQDGDQTSSNEISASTPLGDGEQSETAADEQGFQMICRPKAFARLVGGGFLGLWRKKIPRPTRSSSDFSFAG